MHTYSYTHTVTYTQLDREPPRSSASEALGPRILGLRTDRASCVGFSRPGSAGFPAARKGPGLGVEHASTCSTTARPRQDHGKIGNLILRTTCFNYVQILRHPLKSRILLRRLAVSSTSQAPGRTPGFPESCHMNRCSENCFSHRSSSSQDEWFLHRSGGTKRATFCEHVTSAPTELGGEIHVVSRNRARTQVLLQARKLHVYGSWHVWCLLVFDFASNFGNS